MEKQGTNNKIERKRPISPHLQVYNIFSKEMTSGPSFLNRFTGIALTVGLLYLVAWLFCMASGKESYDSFLTFITSWFGYLSLFGFTCAFYYHLVNGSRFLIFDLGYRLTKSGMFLSGLGMLLLTGLLVLATWFYIYLEYFKQ